MNLFRFLLDLYANENREESEDCIYSIPFKMPKVPQQQDGSSCGHYVLYYIYRFLMSCPDNFNILEHYPGFVSWTIFVMSVYFSCSIMTLNSYFLVPCNISAEKRLVQSHRI